MRNKQTGAGVNHDPLQLNDVLIDEYRSQRLQPPLTEDEQQKWREAAETERGPVADEREGRRLRNSVIVARFYRWLHANGIRRSALCFSGGGIRSATFGLGVLQGLAQFGILGRFDYLSTVSGGGYLGSWLSAWIHRKGLDAVVRELSSPQQSPLEPEPETVSHLRAYSNYMSPKLGLLSADTWTLVGIYLRNLILNWLVLIPLLAAFLMIPRICVAVVQKTPPAWLSQLSFWAAVAVGIIAIAYILANQPSLADRQRPGSPFRWKDLAQGNRSGQGWFLWYCWLPMLLLSVLATTHWAWLHTDADQIRFYLAGIGPVALLPGCLFFALLLTIGGYCFSQLWVNRKSFSLVPLWTFLLSDLIGAIVLWLVAREIFPFVTSRMRITLDGAKAVLATELYVCFAAPLFLLTFLFAATLFIGLSSRRLGDADREWFARAGAWMLIAAGLWSAASTLVIFGPVGLEYLDARITASLGGLSGLATLLLGRSPKTQARKAPLAGTDAGGIAAKVVVAVAAPVFAILVLVFLSLGTSLLIARISDAIFSVDWGITPCLPYDKPLGLMNIIYYSPLTIILILTVVFVAVGAAMGCFIDINKFSLHGAYRDRLIRAYLGASRPDRERRPNPFTGFDENDNIQMHELRTTLLRPEVISNPGWFVQRLTEGSDEVSRYVYERLSKDTRALLHGKVPEDQLRSALSDDLNRLIQENDLRREDAFKNVKIENIVPPVPGEPSLHSTWINLSLLREAFPGVLEGASPCRPFHIVNMALNLVAGRNLAWQQRKAESFTASALHCGSFRLGYRDSARYGFNKNLGRAISLGTAAAISGAAASPNMGYHSSPLVSFLLTLFNVRLGWWLGNPGERGRDTYGKAGPFFAPEPLLAEAFGLTDDENRHVYLSDGGHFENLGLYEMILRRCHNIVVVDGSQDPKFTFEDLANAVGKIRVDLGVPIVFDKIRMLPSGKSRKSFYGQHEEKRQLDYCALGRICYSSADSSGEDGKADPRGKNAQMDGRLLYIKASLNGSEPVDVFNYARSNPDFPHQTTADQFFSESQFESYRALGKHAVDTICRGRESYPSMESFFDKVESDLGEPPECRGGRKIRLQNPAAE